MRFRKKSSGFDNAMTDHTPPTRTGTLSIVIPVYNEAATISSIVDAVQAVHLDGIQKEIVIVNDCSRDDTGRIIEEIAKQQPNVRAFHPLGQPGQRRGAAHGFSQCTGDWVIIQDADLEYDPNEYRSSRADPGRQGRRGLRVALPGSGAHRVVYYWQSMGNKFLTWLSNMFTNINLTDMETCYKVFRREIIGKIRIEENRFGFEPEITAKVARLHCRIYEVGISYYGRTYEEGKKIGWRDGVRAIVCILKYNVIR